MSGRIFLLSPAKAGGKRYSYLLREQAMFDLAIRLREGTVTIGEIYSFISGLYFRGKLAYADAFRAAPDKFPHALIILPGRGLVAPETIVDIDQLRATADVPVSENNPTFRDSLLRAAKTLDAQREGCALTFCSVAWRVANTPHRFLKSSVIAFSSLPTSPDVVT